MFNIIKADLFRMRKSLGMLIFWLLAIWLFVIPIMFGGEVSMGIRRVVLLGAKPDVNQLTYNFNFYFLLIMPVFTIIVSDLSKKTVKNTITSTISRKTYYISKTVLCVAYGVFAFFVSNAGIYVLNRMVNGTDNSTALSDYILACLYQLPVIILILSLLVMAAFLLGKASIFNACAIIFPLAFQIIVTIFNQIEATQSFAENYLMKYELGTMLSLLAAEPLSVNSDDSYINTCFIISAVVSIAALVLGYFVFSKKEIK